MPKKKREWKLFVYDIVEFTDKIIEYTKNMSFESFSQDRKTIDAVVRNIEIIGDAVKNIPKEKKEIYTHINWKNISGMRDILIHDYFGIDLDIIWEVITIEIPKLQKDIQIVIDDFNNELNS